MTPFSDDDLKRLKEMLEPGIKGHPYTLFREVEEFFRFKVDALLARLEAAEGPFTSKWEEGTANWWLDYEEFKRAWRMAAGK
jgi:hypothetical protein